MASVIRSWFRTKKTKKESEHAGGDDYEVFRQDLRCKSRHSEKPSPTAAYHTITQPRACRGPRSCPGETLDQAAGRLHIRPSRSFDSDTDIPSHNTIHRRRRQQQAQHLRRTNAVTSEYGSGDPSPTTLYSTYNRNLDDSDSDSWTAEYERVQHIRELECKLREQRKKLKDYKERLRAERDLRIVNERSMMEEVEKYKRELKREQRERKATEQRYLDIITNTKTRLTLLEQQQLAPHHYSTLPPLPILSDEAVNMCNNLPLRKGAGEFMCPMVPTLPARGSFEQHISEVDETKNFRGEETLEDIVETARSSDHTVKSANTEALMRITSNKRYLSTTMLQSDDSDNDNNGYVTTCECLSKAISNENVLKDAGPVRTSL